MSNNVLSKIVAGACVVMLEQTLVSNRLRTCGCYWKESIHWYVKRGLWC